MTTGGSTHNAGMLALSDHAAGPTDALLSCTAAGSASPTGSLEQGATFVYSTSTVDWQAVEASLALMGPQIATTSSADHTGSRARGRSWTNCTLSETVTCFAPLTAVSTAVVLRGQTHNLRTVWAIRRGPHRFLRLPDFILFRIVSMDRAKSSEEDK